MKKYSIAIAIIISTIIYTWGSRYELAIDKDNRYVKINKLNGKVYGLAKLRGFVELPDDY